MRIPAKQALMRQLVADGVRVIFGNPGTLEESLLEAIKQCAEIKYVLGLQEAAVAAMADGYARAARRPAIVQVHSAVGLGNATGVLYEAHRSGTPMLVLAGETEVPLQAFDGFLGGDLVSMAKPVTKWAARVSDGSQLLRMVRRALKVAATPPQGPVFLALPMDVLDQLVTADINPTPIVDTCARIPDDRARYIATALINAEHPLLLVGDGVAVSGAQAAVEALATLLAIPVYRADASAVDISFRAPTFMGLLGHAYGDDTRRVTLPADVILAVGCPLFAELFPSKENYFSQNTKLFQIDLNSWEIGKNFPIEYGAQADPRLCLEDILDHARNISSTRAAELALRRAALATQIAQTQAAWEDQQEAESANGALTPAQMMRILSESLPSEAMIYDESITSTDALLHYLKPERPESYILARGGCIGVGWPGAIGASFACPGRTVVAPSGDGSALYVVPSLWTAAKYNRKIVFVVCNNSSYRILKVNIQVYWEKHGSPEQPFPFMDLDCPTIDFAKIAEGFGVPAAQVSTATQLSEQLARAFAGDGPFLLDVLLDGSVPVPPHSVRGHGGAA
jgi:benzoylformate decarboxylase